MRRDTPSRTARKVALNVVTLGAVPGMDEVLPEGSADVTAQLLVAAGEVGPATIRFARTALAVAIYRAFDWMMPGQFEAFAHRKAYCEAQVRAGVADGARQVLVLGAGYDTLGLRLAEAFPAVQFVEIDHPATATRKAAGVSSLGWPANLGLIPVDLGAHRLVDVLAAYPAWDCGARSVVVAEGLTQYLPADAVRELFEQCGGAVGPGSRIAFTYLRSDGDGRPDAGRWTELLLWLLEAGGEPWLWSAGPGELPRLLSDAGWSELPELAGGACRRGVEYYSAAVRGPLSSPAGAGSGTEYRASASCRAACSG